MNFDIGVTLGLGGLLSAPPAIGKEHPFELRAGPFFAGELAVVSLSGRERVNDVYQYEVVFATDAPPAVVTNAIFGMPACLTIKAPGHEPRVVQGIASVVEALGAVPGELGSKRRRYRVVIVPRLWLLRHRRRNRVFQNKSAPEIVAIVLAGVGINDSDCRWRADRASYPALPFVYQRGETDYDFFRRVLAAAGIFFFYEHANGFLDSMFGGAASAVAGAVGAAAGMIGGAVASVVGAVESAAGMVPVLNFGDAPGHTAAVTGAVAGMLGDALEGALGAVADAVGAGAIAGLVEEPSDTLAFDDDMGADADYERVYVFELKKSLATKELRMLDRAVEAHASWVGVASTGGALDLSLSAGVSLSAGLSVASSGLSALGSVGASLGGIGASLGLDADAPAIPASMLREERYQVDRDVWQGAPDKRMKMELGRLRSEHQVAVGSSDSRRLGAGYRFTLAGHPIGLVNGEYTVTSLDVTGVHPDFLGKEEAVYRNRFRCIPSSVAARPKRPRRRPKPGLEVARVVNFIGGTALPGLEANPAGYVRVRFRWDILDDDRATPNGELEIGGDDVYSVWLPVVQPWAGDGYGAQFIPREGMEVLVGFMEDQSERPVILGCLFSDVNRPPWPETIDHQKIGIRSQSRPANGGYSEVSIDDRQGDEVVQIRGERDLDIAVVRESRTWVGADKITVVQGGVTTNVAEDVHQNVGGSHSTVVRGSDNLQIDGSAAIAIASASSRNVGGNEVTRIDGSCDQVVGADARLEVGGSRSTSAREDVTAVAERYVLTVGTAGGDAAESDTYVWGTHRVGAKQRVLLESETELVLRCGTSEIHLTPNAIVVNADTIDVKAAKQLSLAGNGPTMSLADGMQVMSKQIALQSSAARLDLSSSAALTSSSVQLGKPTQYQPPPPSLAPPDPNQFQLTLLSPDGTPLASRRFLLELGGMTVDGTTDASGQVTGSAPPEVTTGRCTVWTKDFPEGPRVTFDIAFEATIEPASSVAGAQKRLQNLGYFTGDLTGEMSHHLRDAILVFQYAHDLKRTGLLDGDTTSKLAEIHP